jgi:predicted RecA/RadA family phage recombinase
MAREAYLARRTTDQDPTMRFTPTSATTAGEVVKINTSATRAIAGVSLECIAANDTGTFDIKNIYDFPCGSAQTFSAGDQVYWDHEGTKAIPSASANGEDDYCLGTCEQARATTDKAFVRVRLNFGSSAFVRNSSSSSSSSS